MRKSAFVVFIYLLICLISYSRVNAQAFDAQKAYQDYQYQQSNYLQAESEYEEAKTFYKKNPTLQLREEARKKTLSFLKSRDQLLIVYLTALRIQTVETTGFSDDEKGALFSNVDPEVAWYQAHVTSYGDSDDLNTLFSKSDESKVRYQNKTKAVVLNALYDISLSKEIGFRIDHQAIYINLKNNINDKVSLGTVKIDPFNRWLGDIDNVLQILSQNETLAKSRLPKFYSLNGTLNSTYQLGVEQLDRSVNPLFQLNNYLTEMLTYLQSQ